MGSGACLQPMNGTRPATTRYVQVAGGCPRLPCRGKAIAVGNYPSFFPLVCCRPVSQVQTAKMVWVMFTSWGEGGEEKIDMNTKIYQVHPTQFVQIDDFPLRDLRIFSIPRPIGAAGH
jgi:hypothetical protein